MGLGPVYASKIALERAELALDDMGTIEINEAFAAQVLACKKAFESEAFARAELGRDRALGTLDLARTNVNGGAIAMGHPVGATGARLVLSAAHELAVGPHRHALATLCIGGGQGGAMVLERIES
jgi:acetyl-CoA acetyltransferase